MTRPPHHPRRRPSSPPPPIDNTDPVPVDGPEFAQPHPTPDPRQFRIPHPSDAQAYEQIDALNRAHRLGPMPFPAPRGLPEPRLTLTQVLGPNGDDVVKRVTQTGRTRIPLDRRHRVDKRAGKSIAGRRQDDGRLRGGGFGQHSPTSSSTLAT